MNAKCNMHQIFTADDTRDAAEQFKEIAYTGDEILSITWMP
jgi:hypothetical protein